MNEPSASLGALAVALVAALILSLLCGGTAIAALLLSLALTA